MDATAVIAMIGGIALLIGIFGGGVKAKEVEIPLIPKFVRILSSVTGIILLGVAIWLLIRSSEPAANQTNSTAIPAISTLIEGTPFITNSPTKNVPQPTIKPTNNPTPTINIEPTTNSQDATEINSSPQFLLIGVRCGYSYTVEAGRPIVLKYGAWGAKDYELASQNAEHMYAKLLVNGRTVNGVQQPPISSENIDYSQCGNLQAGSYWIAHIAHLEPLIEGEHVIEVEYIIDEPITDGFSSDLYGPGSWGYQTYKIIAEPLE